MTTPKTQQAAARVRALLAPVVAAGGRDLEDVTVTAAGRRSVVRVLVDADGGISLDDVAEVSHAVSAALEEADAADPSLFGPSYVLEVSSPGVDRPLTAPRHWRRNVGRLIVVTPVQGAAFQGRLTAAEEQSVTLDVDGEVRTLPYEAVRSGLVQVEFRRLASETPDDAQQDDLPDEGDEEDDA